VELCVFCPFCFYQETKVIDSRLAAGGNQIKRRRVCTACQERFSTFESAELAMPKVIKRDGRRSSFNEEKIRSGLLRALEKRPVSIELFEDALCTIKRKILQQGEREVSTTSIGKICMELLLTVDQVAYIRFASVYSSFEDLGAFQQAIKGIEKKIATCKDKS
jgi:transcriptional repressor NrdR